jgi:DNA-binding MarR family transcriptional regulator
MDNLGLQLHSLSTALERQSDIFLLDRLDIGFAQFKILLALKQKEGVEQKEISKLLGQTEASISRQIALLQDGRLISVKTDKKDRRKHRVYLLLKGERTINKALVALNGFYQPVFANISAHQQAELSAALQKISLNLQLNLYKD